MAKKKSSIPKDIAIGISKLAEATGKDKTYLLKEMKEIIKTDESINKMDNKEAKIRFAWTILASRYSISGGKDYYILPLATPQVRKIPSGKFVGDLACLAQEVETNDDGEESLGEIFYAVGTFWDDSAKLLRDITREQPYKMTTKSKEEKKGIALFGNPIFEETEHEFPNPKEYFDKHLSTNTDARVLRLTVLKTEEGENERGEYAYYETVDDSILGHTTHRIYVDPDDLNFGQASVLYSIGTVNVAKDGKVRWNHQCFIPEMAFERTVETQAVDMEDSVDLNMDDEEESPKEEEKEDQEETEDEEDEEDEDDEIFGV